MPRAAADVGTTAYAGSLADGAIEVDGKLDDEAWALLEPFTDFVQRDPDEGMPATERTERETVGSLAV